MQPGNQNETNLVSGIVSSPDPNMMSSVCKGNTHIVANGGGGVQVCLPIDCFECRRLCKSRGFLLSLNVRRVVSGSLLFI